MLPRESSRQSLQMRDARAQSAGHGRDQVLHLCKPLQLGQVRYDHRSIFAKPAEVVAQQVGDHHQLGAFLLARLQLVAKPRVEVGGGAAGRVPLIGRVVTWLPLNCKNCSGDELAN